MSIEVRKEKVFGRKHEKMHLVVHAVVKVNKKINNEL